MREQFCEEIGLYCGIAGEVVILTFDEEQIIMLGRKGYAIHSSCCSRYAECGCKHYGLADECKSIFKQAEKTVKKNRGL